MIPLAAIGDISTAYTQWARSPAPCYIAERSGAGQYIDVSCLIATSAIKTWRGALHRQPWRRASSAQGNTIRNDSHGIFKARRSTSSSLRARQPLDAALQGDRRPELPLIHALSPMPRDAKIAPGD